MRSYWSVGRRSRSPPDASTAHSHLFGEPHFVAVNVARDLWLDNFCTTSDAGRLIALMPRRHLDHTEILPGVLDGRRAGARAGAVSGAPEGATRGGDPGLGGAVERVAGDAGLDDRAAESFLGLKPRRGGRVSVERVTILRRMELQCKSCEYVHHFVCSLDTTWTWDFRLKFTILVLSDRRLRRKLSHSEHHFLSQSINKAALIRTQNQIYIPTETSVPRGDATGGTSRSATRTPFGRSHRSVL